MVDVRDVQVCSTPIESTDSDWVQLVFGQSRKMHIVGVVYLEEESVGISKIRIEWSRILTSVAYAKDGASVAL